jgi:hypothetical protein
MVRRRWFANRLTAQLPWACMLMTAATALAGTIAIANAAAETVTLTAPRAHDDEERIAPPRVRAMRLPGSPLLTEASDSADTEPAAEPTADIETLPTATALQSVNEATIAALAAERAWTATALQRQANQLAAQASSRHFKAPTNSPTVIFLRGQAARQRGDAIAEALKGHYALRMLLDQLELLDASVETATALQRKAERAMELGLTAPDDDPSWQIQSTLHELRDQRIQVEGRIAEIRQQMAARLQAPWLCDYIPQDPLTAALPAGGCDQWCSAALAQRADYRSWQVIASTLDDATLPEVQQLVEQLIPGWAAGAAGGHPLLRSLQLKLIARRTDPLGNLRSQLYRALEGFASHICSEVQTAAIRLETALQRSELAQEQSDPIDEQLNRARQRIAIGEISEAEESQWLLRSNQAHLQQLLRGGEAKQAELEMRRLLGYWDR